MCHDTCEIGWKNDQDNHFSEMLMKLFSPLTDKILPDYSALTFFRILDSERTEVITRYKIPTLYKLIGLNFDTLRIADKLSYDKITKIIAEFLKKEVCFIYLISSESNIEIQKVAKRFDKKITHIKNKNYPEILKLISISDLFITIDSEIMQLAGICNVPQISLFGDTNPFRWAPIGKNKKFIKLKEFIEDISLDELTSLSFDLIKSKE